ncbi:hypothetical protein JCM8115_003799 [Rhodotorula mucilaginosa]
MSGANGNVTWNGIDLAENRRRMVRGELYTAFVPDLTKERRAASQACAAYNRLATEVSRREQVELFKKIVTSTPDLPPAKDDPDEDEAQLTAFPWAEPPFKVDYCGRISIGENSFFNFNFIVLNTCEVRIGSRCLFGPNVSLFAGTHPLDPAVRNGTAGPEGGGPITIGDDCWFGGNVTVLPNITVGRGVTVGAGSVVTKSVPPFAVVVGNPARIVRKIESEWADEHFAAHPEEQWEMPPKKQ